MDWDKKVEMSELANKRNDSDKDNKKFRDFILNHVNEFDGQSWEIFVELIDIIPEEFNNNFEFWKEMYSQIKKGEFEKFGLGLIPAFRLAAIETMCEDDLGFEENENNNN